MWLGKVSSFEMPELYLSDQAKYYWYAVLNACIHPGSQKRLVSLLPAPEMLMKKTVDQIWIDLPESSCTSHRSSSRHSYESNFHYVLFLRGNDQIPDEGFIYLFYAIHSLITLRSMLFSISSGRSRSPLFPLIFLAQTPSSTFNLYVGHLMPLWHLLSCLAFCTLPNHWNP